jgi:hypothetical protein
MKDNSLAEVNARVASIVKEQGSMESAGGEVQKDCGWEGSANEGVGGKIPVDK